MTTNNQITAPAPGVYNDVPAATYHAWPLPSNSLLNHMARSPLHCRYAMDHPVEQTPDMLFGEAFHALVLEPDLYAQRFITAGKCGASKAKGELCGNPGKVYCRGEWFCGIHGKGVVPDERPILSLDDESGLFAMRDAIDAHPWAGRALAMRGETELSIVSDDPATGVRCKMRADRIVDRAPLRCVLDIKTTRNASPAEFARTIHQRGYHRQGAMYLRGCVAAGIDADAFAIIAIDKEPPYGVAAYHLDEEDLAAGDEEVTNLLRTYGECHASGKWPGYGDQIQPIRLPAWARPRPDVYAAV